MGNKIKKKQERRGKKAVKRARIEANGGQSKYAAKKAQGITSNSPFYFDHNDPSHESTDDARRREFEERQRGYGQ